jgi:adenine-specific DNA-methyltransferase
MFPEVACEGRIDLDKLRLVLGEAIDDRPERYTFSWAGKRDAIRILAEPSRATLVPDRPQSLDFDGTGNVFIEGDNLEVLKLLYKSYFGRVKMIYIDPPYNTGNDFVYPDNFRDPLDTYLKLTGQRDSDGNLLTSNTDASGRYHSAWLSMLYPRLVLARQLLRDDGVIFVSIDDHEVHNLRLIMNEIFGEENFVAQMVWKSRQFLDSRAVTGVSTDHEYVVAFARRAGRFFRGNARDEGKFANPDNDSRGPWMSRSMLGLATAEQRPNLHYRITDPTTGLSYSPPAETGWRYAPDRMAKLMADGRVLFPSGPDGRPREKKFRCDIASDYTAFSTLVLDIHTAHGTAEIRDILGSQAFDFPKPSALLAALTEQAAADNDIILDFFAGSATTAHAVLNLNRTDGGDRRFIMVQLPEPLAKPVTLHDGCELRTIADIGRERIRRVVARLKDARRDELGLPEREAPEDLGFRAYRLAESNLRPWAGSELTTGALFRSDSNAADRLEGAAVSAPQGGAAPPPATVPAAAGQNEPSTPGVSAPAPPSQPALFTDPLKDDWTPEAVITEIALREGYSLSFSATPVPGLPVGVTVYRVHDPARDQHFYICLDDRVTLTALDGLNLERTDLFVCRDSALDDDTAANLALQCRLKVI